MGRSSPTSLAPDGGWRAAAYARRPGPALPATLSIPLAVDLGVGLAALVNLLLFARAGDATRMVLAAVVVAVAGAPAARRAIALLRRGVLDRDALAWAAILACFAAGVIDLLIARHAFTPPAWIAALGMRAVRGQPPHGAGFEAAAILAVASLTARVAEAAVLRRALGRGADLAPWAPEPPAPDTWEDAAVRGIFTAALGLATFALVTHGLLGVGLLGPVALFAAAAALAAASPSSILVAAPAARAIAVLRARAAGVLVESPAALVALAGVDAACLEKEGAVACGEIACPEHAASLDAVRGLHARGVHAFVLSSDGPEPTALAAGRLCVPGAGGLGPAEKALAIRDLQHAGARVLLVADGRSDPACAPHADVAVVLAPGSHPAPVAAPIVIAEGRLDDLPWLVDLGRALRAVVRQNLVLGAVFNAALIPAAALGYVSPLAAALAVLAETLLGLANAARLLRWPRCRKAQAPAVRDAARGACYWAKENAPMS